MGKPPKYEYIPIHSAKDKRRFKHTRQKKKVLETEKKRLANSIAKIKRRQLSDGQINSAFQELKKKKPDFAKIKRVEQMIQTEITDLQANRQKINRIIRLERELHGIEGVVAGLPYKSNKSYAENTIKLNQKILKNLRQMRARKERF